MGRKPAETKTVQIGVRVNEELLDALDREVEAIKREQGLSVNRSIVIRQWLEEMARSRAKRK